MGRYKKGMEFKGCDEDCFNCPYPDCLKAGYKMKPDKYLQAALQLGDLISAPHMYALELGGCGRENPNISRKFYR